jgi:hypothetical protein
MRRKRLRRDHDERGRFVDGNKAGRGNPAAQRAQKLRIALFDAVGAGDFRKVVRRIVRAAQGGDLVAARLLFDRLLGPPVEIDLLAKLEEIESMVFGDAKK